jgi:hypothetical protein
VECSSVYRYYGPKHHGHETFGKAIHRELQDSSQEVGLIINQDKTKFMRISKGKYKGDNKVSIGDYCFERVSNVPHLGSVINHNNKMTEEISQRTKK